MLKSNKQAGSGAADTFAALNLIGMAPCFCDALETVRRVANTDVTVLIRGETGTGKELAARALHYLSDRRDGPFIPVNCGALPDGLVESELFGHERGAFTDAKQAFKGLVAQANGGTLFLDEVDAMSVRGQAVLLRFLQDHAYRPVGGRTVIGGDVRIVASSNADLEALVGSGAFRQDLLFRLDILAVTMPPLRARGDDVLLLARHFLRRFAMRHDRSPKALAEEAIGWMLRHRWPGNVRELENLMLRAFLLSDGEEIRLREAGHIAVGRASHAVDAFEGPYRTAKARALEEFERRYLDRLLVRAQGNISLAARMSRKDRSTLNKLVRKHGLSKEASRLRAQI